MLTLYFIYLYYTKYFVINKKNDFVFINYYFPMCFSTSEESMQKCIEMEMKNIDAIFSKKLSNNELKGKYIHVE